MRCNSIDRYFRQKLLDELDARRAEMPIPEIVLSRVAENAANYSPQADWENDVQELITLMEART